MKIGFVVNDVSREIPKYTTTHLAREATKMGHKALYIGAADFSFEPDGSLAARAWSSAAKDKSLEDYLAGVQASNEKRIQLGELDVVFLRFDPAADAEDRPWAPTAAIAFGQLIAASGVLVVNDAGHLADALSKAYFQHFPEVVRPRTLISRDEAAIKDFVADLGGRAVLKPLQGSGGTGVFQLSKRESPNLGQIFEAISRDGYVVAQEFLPKATEGDVRVFVMNGEPLVRDGQYAAFRRVNKGDDMRSNMSAGGKASKAKVTDEMLRLADIVKPKLTRDGMFLVGLDIVGDKLMEINVFSPGGLGSCQELYGVNFAEGVIESLERKIELRKAYGPTLSNQRLATI
ncbi:MAG TPA: glutathione synthetase, partial [Aeromicrobium sp.]|nr:glutathione synthetase [Aeromicrobium sp.]